jgi:hypothetical protein
MPPDRLSPSWLSFLALFPLADPSSKPSLATNVRFSLAPLINHLAYFSAFAALPIIYNPFFSISCQYNSLIYSFMQISLLPFDIQQESITFKLGVARVGSGLDLKFPLSRNSMKFQRALKDF